MPNSDNEKDEDFKGPNVKKLVGKLFRRNPTRNFNPVSVSANNSPDRQLGAGANAEGVISSKTNWAGLLD